MTTQEGTDRFIAVTELAGHDISVEQLERLCHRYHWAARSCAGKDVVEVACGGGQGLGLLADVATSLLGTDISPEVLQQARSTYGREVDLACTPADQIDRATGTLDVVLLFEALYYLPDAHSFFSEAARVLRPGGQLLITTANKDLFDFTPSPHSCVYYGVSELCDALTAHGFTPEVFGYLDTATLSPRQRIFRPLKYIANRFGLMPRTMVGKALLKKIVFGSMTKMPSRIDGIKFDYRAPIPLQKDKADTNFKVIYCAALKD